METREVIAKLKKVQGKKASLLKKDAEDILKEFGTTRGSPWSILKKTSGSYMEAMSDMKVILQAMAKTFPTAAAEELVATHKASIAAFLKIDKRMQSMHKKAIALMKAKL
jgi:hypothetical protein